MRTFLVRSFCVLMVLFSLSGFLQIAESAEVDFEMQLNDGGFVSFDTFHAEMQFRNSGEALLGARLFAILEIHGEFYFWPDFTSQFDYQLLDIEEDETNLTILAFTFPDIDDFIPFGPMYMWGAWFQERDNQGIDVVEFWLDEDHKWTPTPPPVTPTPFSEPGAIYATDPIVGNLRSVPAGGFVQGSPETEPCRSGNESQFTHVLTHNLIVMQTEVSFGMWDMLRAVQPTLPEFEMAWWQEYAVRFVTWHESILFANLLSRQSSLTQCYYTDPDFMIPLDATNYIQGQYYCDFEASGYRLPTEGEWEYFCRAGTTDTFSCDEPEYDSGNCNLCGGEGTHPTLEQYCWYCCNSNSFSVIGTRMPNPWNLHDVHGSVFEWCWDWFGPYPTSATDFTGATSGFTRVARGGSWLHGAELARSAFRAGIMPHHRLDHCGFRLVRTIP
jgi:formylglycine-generating enzyme required for sulfatase activity